MTDSDFRFESAAALGPDEPMSDELCTFVLSLLRDGRSLHPRLAERAEAWADDHPSCRRALGDFAVVSDLLGSETPAHVSGGFTNRVLDTWSQLGRGADALPLLRRLSMAAAVLLGLTLALDMTFPAGAVADDELARQGHQIDRVRPDPFSAPDLKAGLEFLLPDVAPLGSPRASLNKSGGDL